MRAMLLLLALGACAAPAPPAPGAGAEGPPRYLMGDWRRAQPGGAAGELRLSRLSIDAAGAQVTTAEGATARGAYAGRTPGGAAVFRFAEARDARIAGAEMICDYPSPVNAEAGPSELTCLIEKAGRREEERFRR